MAPLVYNTPPGFVPGIHVYDKTGKYVGVITLANDGNSRSRGITYGGSWQFTVPVVTDSGAANPELNLIVMDSFVICANSARNSPWAGAITQVDKADGVWTVTADDVFSTLEAPLVWGLRNLKQQKRTVKMDPVAPGYPEWSYEEDITPKPGIEVRSGDPAAIVVQRIMDLANTWFGAQREVLWETDIDSSNGIFGDQQLTGTAISALQTIAQAAFCEFWWEIRPGREKFTPVLIWRDDTYTVPGGLALIDGPGGNVGAASSLQESVSGTINAIRIYGSVTTIEDHIPPYAKVFLTTEFTPVAEVWAKPEGRRRARLDDSASIHMANVQVAWSLDPLKQEEDAKKAEDKYRRLFADYVHAVHDQLGRPFHDGWSWAGPDPKLTKRVMQDRAWHYKKLFLTKGASPVAVVMKTKDSYIKVTYDRVKDAQKVTSIGQGGLDGLPDFDTSTVLDWEWRKMAEWDPFRDGTGAARDGDDDGYPGELEWHIIPYSEGDRDAGTTLAYGIGPNDTELEVGSVKEFPQTFPYIATIDGDEDIMVMAHRGYTTMLVNRGVNKTPRSIHEASAPVQYLAARKQEAAAISQPTDEEQLETEKAYLSWPEGAAYGKALLERINRARRRVSVACPNLNALWASLEVGQTHSLTLRPQYSGWSYSHTVRLMGWAVNEDTGACELIVEEWP